MPNSARLLLNCFRVAAYSEVSSAGGQTEDIQHKSIHQRKRKKRNRGSGRFSPMSFLIIPAEELPILNLPEFKMFMAICREHSGESVDEGKERNKTKPRLGGAEAHLEAAAHFSDDVLQRHGDVVERDLAG